MSSWNRFWSVAAAAWLAVVTSGCAPAGQSQADEEKEPHYVLGQSRVNAMDYQGAIDAFEESLEVNPHSAAAHFQLGMLYEKESDPAAAIYHYERYLKYRPNADNAAVVRQRIYACKQELAADVMPLPSTPAAQEQLEQLTEQNRQLQQQVVRLQEVVQQWSTWYAAQSAAAKTNPSPLAQSPVTGPQPRPPAPPERTVQPQPARFAQTGEARRSHPEPRVKPDARPRAHVVGAGETAVRIARKADITLRALEEANPGVNLSRIRVGQVLNLPPP
ncbi:MAG: LysM peptidoglycan-binding domain-containing protein [Verrucomicrobiota bacterium]|nr:LysM peptidoglycan-binding domain-containing protein [Verrucomicrobiota bacterium]